MQFMKNLARALLMLTPFTAAQAQALIYPEAQLEQFVAPIALYPDPLLDQVLNAATHPEQIVQAQKWANDLGQSSWSGQQANADLQQRPWDDSVKNLTAFPGLLDGLAGNIRWISSIGAAYQNQPDDLKDAIQNLRHDAYDNGSLSSNTDQNVAFYGNDIVIEPTRAGPIIVPAYDVGRVYGTWPDPDHQPYYLNGLAYGSAPIITTPLFIYARPQWPQHHWEWRRENEQEHHRLENVTLPEHHPRETDFHAPQISPFNHTTPTQVIPNVTQPVSPAMQKQPVVEFHQNLPDRHRDERHHDDHEDHHEILHAQPLIQTPLHPVPVTPQPVTVQAPVVTVPKPQNIPQAAPVTIPGQPNRGQIQPHTDTDRDRKNEEKKNDPPKS